MGAMRKSTYTTEYTALVKELRSLRAAASLTQRALAAKLAVPPSWVAKVESGERRIDVIEFCWLVVACDGDPQQVFQRIERHIQRSRNVGGRS